MNGGNPGAGSTYAFEASTNQFFTCDIGAFVAFQVRLSTVIAGAGTVNVSLAANAMTPMYDFGQGDIKVPKTLSADWNATVANATTSTEVVGSFLKFLLNGRTSISILFTTAPTTSTYTCDGSTDDENWQVVSCWDFTLTGVVARSATITNPVTMGVYTPNIYSGVRWFRIRQTAHTGPSAVIVANFSYGRPYDGFFGVSGYNGVQVPNRFIGMAVSDYTTNCTGGMNCLVWLGASQVLPAFTFPGLVTHNIPGVATRVSAAWTSATAIDTTLAVATKITPVVTVTARTTSTITGGAIGFEFTDDDTNWFPVALTASNNYILSSASSTNFWVLVASTSISWVGSVPGATQFRVRINPALTGTGTLNIAITSSETGSNFNNINGGTTLTKGTQGINGSMVQQLRDSGRTELHFYATAFAAGATGVETLFTLTRSADQATTSTATTFTPTSGKRFRITGITFATLGNAVATAETTTFNLRVVSSLQRQS